MTLKEAFECLTFWHYKVIIDDPFWKYSEYDYYINIISTDKKGRNIRTNYFKDLIEYAELVNKYRNENMKEHVREWLD